MSPLLSSLEFLHPQNLKHFSDPLARLISGRLWLQVLVAMGLGIGAGLLLSPETYGWFSESTAAAIGEWLALPGKLFLALIQMIVVPLILASIINGIASATDVAQLKSTGLWVSVYFVVTTILAAILGIAMAMLIRPGDYSEPVYEDKAQKQEVQALQQDAMEIADEKKSFRLSAVPEKITNILPTNPLDSLVQGDMLQIVIFALVIGIGLLSIDPSSSKPLLDLFSSIQQVCMAVVGFVMSFAPLAVFGLLAQAMLKTGPDMLAGLGIYTLTVIVGMAALFAMYVLIAMFLGGRKPWEFIGHIREPILLAFSTNSSAATMPITVKHAEESLKIRSSIAQFVVPLGATVNMGGSALYQGLAVIFMAQMYNIDLPLGALAALVATTLGASIGTPAVPGVGIIVLATVLNSVGVPMTGLALIVGLDRLLERFRTSLNVTGDLVACAVMDRLSSGRESQT